jgi:endonuclease/exonuclease/phosphatase (EEP) superfamily protein YafD
MVVVGVWCATAACAAFVGARLVGLTDRHGRLFAAATLTPFVIVPAVTLCVAAALLRQRVALVVNLVVLALVVTWAAPSLRWWSTAPDVAGPTYVVAASNIAGVNDDLDRPAAAVADIDADVLAVVELTPRARASLAAAGIDEAYPYQVLDDREGAFGSGIYSRYPLRDRGPLEVGGVRMARADVELPTGPVTVVAVHVSLPLDRVEPMYAEVDALRQMATSPEVPLILAGDFNATAQHQPFRLLLAAGLTDAHLVTGRGWSASWPSDRRIPPFALIDHVLVSDALTVADVDEVPVPGSDHLAVVATVGRATA